MWTPTPSCLLIAFFTLLASVASVLTQQPGTNPVKIFVVVGQSNMQGKGQIAGVSTPSTLDYTVANDPEGKYQFLKSGGSYLVSDDVWIRDEDANAGGLEPGYGANSASIGPELGFGHKMGDLNENQILIVKAAWGGRSTGMARAAARSTPGRP